MSTVDREYLQGVSSAVNQILFILNIKFISQLIWFSEQLTNGEKKSFILNRSKYVNPAKGKDRQVDAVIHLK